MGVTPTYTRSVQDDQGEDTKQEKGDDTGAQNGDQLVSGVQVSRRMPFGLW